MGFISGLFGPRWEKSKKRAEKAFAEGDHASAFLYVSEALEDCPEGERDALESIRKPSAAALFKMHRAAALVLLEEGTVAAAEERFELARRFATSAEEREELDRDLHVVAERRMDHEEEEEGEDIGEAEDATSAGDPNRLSDQDAFNLLTGALPEELAERYDGLGEEFRRAFLALQEGRPEEALPWFETAAKTSQDSIVLFEYGSCLRALGRHKEAVDALSRAEEQDKTWLAIKLTLAEACWADQQLDRAEQVLQRAVDQTGDDPAVYVAVARHAVLTKNSENGLEAVAAGLEIEPQNRSLWMLKGQLHELAGRKEEAVKAYDAVVTRGWHFDAEQDRIVYDTEAGLLAARLYVDLGQSLDRAEEFYRAALTNTPPHDRWRVELPLGECLIKAGKREEGEALVRQTAYEIPPTEVVGQLFAAHLLGDKARVDELLPSLTEAQRKAWDKRQGK